MAPMSGNDEFLCFGDERAFASFPEEIRNVKRILVPQGTSPTLAAAASGNRSPADMLRLTEAVWRAKPSVFFSPTVYTYFPLPPGLSAVVTVHDTIAERFPTLTLPTRRSRLFWQLKVGLALRQSTLVLTVSDYSARSISEVLGVPRDRIRVAVEAPAAAYSPSEPADVVKATLSAGLPVGAQWFTYVGGFSPHKRVDTIIEAHARLVREGIPAYLLLVGATNGDVFLGEIDRLRALVGQNGSADFVKWTGFVPDEELRHLHTGAVAALLPSECEGFGLPAVEAAACAAPVVATIESPLPELLAGGGFFVKPGDTDSIFRSMRRLATEPRTRAAMGRTARERATLLTWESCASSALGAIREAAA
jgi:glycosyltransferase involved in cell wall biosynthesis